MKKAICMKGRGAWLASVALVLFFSAGLLPAEELQAIKLNPPNLKRGLPFMETLAVRASAREFSEKELGLKTRPKASMDKAKIKELLKLDDTQTIFLNHPVGYAK